LLQGEEMLGYFQTVFKNSYKSSDIDKNINKIAAEEGGGAEA